MFDKFTHDLLGFFAHDEDGAVTVDWVVLTAAIVVIGVAALAIIQPAFDDAATYISASLENVIT